MKGVKYKDVAALADWHMSATRWLPATKLKAKKTIHLFGYRRLRDLMAIVFWRKDDIDNGVGKYEGCPTLYENITNFGPQMT